nr:zinc finger, CCHC-type [Tanacetum cinerariifolium]
MQIILEANGLWEMIEPNEKTEADNKKDKTTIAFLYQALTEEQLLQITKYKTAKAIWEALKTRHLREERVQQARLQTLKSDFEMLQMKEDETIDTFTTKLTTLVNKASNLGHTMEDKTLLRKLLNAVPDRYLQIVTSIEQYSDLSEMTFEEEIGRLKTYEERINYKGKQVDNQDRLLFTRYEEQGRRRGHGGSNQSRGQENNFKKETHNNSNKLTHDKSKEIPFNLDLTDFKQQGVSSESLDGGITESMNQPGIKENIHSKNSKLDGGNNQKYDQPGLKEDHNNEGCVSGSMEIVSQILNLHHALGGALNPSSTTTRMVEVLEARPKVKRVYYPRLKSHPENHIAKKQRCDAFEESFRRRKAEIDAMDVRRKVISKVIGEEQNAFIQGRYILDGGLIANETCDYLKKEKKKAFLLNVDFKKAYDSVNWNFIQSTLLQMGFGERWCKWVQTCQKSASVLVLVNGSPTLEFKMKRGLGKAIFSHHFFTLWRPKGLNVIKKDAVRNGIFKGVNVTPPKSDFAAKW